MTLALIGAHRTRGIPGSSPWLCPGHWHVPRNDPGFAVADVLLQRARRMVSAGIRIMTAPAHPAVRSHSRGGRGQYRSGDQKAQSGLLRVRCRTACRRAEVHGDRHVTAGRDREGPGSGQLPDNVRQGADEAVKPLAELAENVIGGRPAPIMAWA